MLRVNESSIPHKQRGINRSGRTIRPGQRIGRVSLSEKSSPLRELLPSAFGEVRGERCRPHLSSGPASEAGRNIAAQGRAAKHTGSPQAMGNEENQPHACRLRVRIRAQKKVRPFDLTLKRRLPTLPRENRSTIGVSELNFSVRNGKRWNLTAITT